MHDPVNHPKHYTGHPSGAIEDLKKAVWYIQDEITKREENDEPS